MLGKDVLETGSRHRPAARVHEEFRGGTDASALDPGTQVLGDLFPQRKAAFPAALTHDVNSRFGVKCNCREWQRHQLGGAQSRREAQVDHGSIPKPRPSRRRGRVEQRLDFWHPQESDELLVCPLGRDPQNGVHLFEASWHSVSKESHERLDGSEASIACAGAVASLVLDVTEEVKNERSVELLNRL